MVEEFSADIVGDLIFWGFKLERNGRPFQELSEFKIMNSCKNLLLPENEMFIIKLKIDWSVECMENKGG